jgi:hypothetical protein
MTTTESSHETSSRGLAHKVGRHVHWARTEGLGRLVEEDQLDPRRRWSSWQARRRWRRVNGVSPGTAIPVFLVGVQRSGTNMLVRGLETNPAVAVHNENDRRAFQQFRLRGERVIGELVNESHHQYVLFKPLCDSGRIAAVVDRLPVVPSARVIWAWRDVDARARSAVSKFADANLVALRRIAAGEGDHLWQALGLSVASRELLTEFDYDQMSPYEAACLFWCVRNRMLLELGLPNRSDVLVSSYEALVADPEQATRALAGFLGLPWTPQMTADIEVRQPSGGERPSIDERIRRHCDELTDQLAAVTVSTAQRHIGGNDLLVD